MSLLHKLYFSNLTLQVLNRSMDPRPTTEVINGVDGTGQLNGLISQIPGSLPLTSPLQSSMVLPQQLITSGTQKVYQYEYYAVVCHIYDINMYDAESTEHRLKIDSI